ncbi:MAG TPA: hypothetical protein VF892_19940 [Pseudonocardiaceae bacterium]
MAILVKMEKVSDDGRSATYRFGTSDGPYRTLVFDRTDERIWPEDGARDAVFRAAAGKLSKVWTERGEAPDSIAYQA